MIKYIFMLISLLFLNTNLYGKNTYHFVSMENIIIEDIGRLVVPEIFKKINLELTVTPMPAKRAENEVFTGNKDGEVMRVWTYLKSNPNTVRVPTSYYFSGTTAFIRKNSNIKINKAEDLRKYRLVKQLGVKHTDNITAGMPSIVNVNSKEAMMFFLQKNRADIALTSTVDGEFILKKFNIKDIIKVEKPLVLFKVYIYIHKSHKDLVPKVDAAIKEMQASGELDTIIKIAEKKVLDTYLNK